MKKNLGEVFYDGRIINLNKTNDEELKEILSNVRTKKMDVKEKIELLLNKMMEV